VEQTGIPAAELPMGRTLKTDLPVVENQLNVRKGNGERKDCSKDKVQYRRNRKQLRKITS
jgi:hypothetical protein